MQVAHVGLQAALTGHHSRSVRSQQHLGVASAVLSRVLSVVLRMMTQIALHATRNPQSHSLFRSWEHAAQVVQLVHLQPTALMAPVAHAILLAYIALEGT